MRRDLLAGTGAIARADRIEDLAVLAYGGGQFPEAPDIAAVGSAWMRMLTLQVGILLKLYLDPPMAPTAGR